MVVFEKSEGDDTLTLTIENIEERPATTWWIRSRYVLSLVGWLLTSLAVITALLVYWTLNTETGNNQVKENSIHPPSHSNSSDPGEDRF